MSAKKEQEAQAAQEPGGVPCGVGLGGLVMAPAPKELHIAISIDGKDVTIEASVASLRALIGAMSAVAANPEGTFIRIVGHGEQRVSFKVPGHEPDSLMAEMMRSL